MSEVVIHQMIETIEFVLGCVSNTASYLRLWALSLAHVELTHVFLDLVLMGIFKNQANMISGFACPALKETDNSTYSDYCHAISGSVMVMIVFPLLVVINAMILMGVDLMECFLHTLRLHWVEFQSKFYKGDGSKFEVFSLEYIIHDETSLRGLKKHK